MQLQHVQQQEMDHQNLLIQQQQAIYQQKITQEMEDQRLYEKDQFKLHEKSINHLSFIKIVYQERLEHQQLHKGQIEMVYQQELDHERNQEAYQNAIYQQEQRELEQEREHLQKIKQLF